MKSYLRLILILLAFCGLITSNGCGGGGSSTNGPVIACDINSFTPNYVMSFSVFPTWSTFPVHVYFIQDSNFTAHRQIVAQNGFDLWNTATSGKINYVVVNNQSAADITVQFDPTTQDGLTQVSYNSLSMSTTPMTLGVKNQLDSDLKAIAAHEFAHALGEIGHSPNPGDLMYSIHFIGTSAQITTNDLNTMETGYCHLFGRNCCARTIPTTGPRIVVPIH